VKCENVILSFNTFFGRLVDTVYYTIPTGTVYRQEKDVPDGRDKIAPLLVVKDFLVEEDRHSAG
jgi:hypothetical protein